MKPVDDKASPVNVEAPVDVEAPLVVATPVAAQKTSEAFLQKSRRGKEMRSKNKYDHHLGSRGYVGKRRIWDKKDRCFPQDKEATLRKKSSKLDLLRESLREEIVEMARQAARQARKALFLDSNSLSASAAQQLIAKKMGEEPEAASSTTAMACYSNRFKKPLTPTQMGALSTLDKVGAEKKQPAKGKGKV